MRLVSFSVTNYRSITKAYRLPIRQSVILIGPNNEGKSNILRALVTSLEILSNLGLFRILRGRLRGSLLRGESYDWSKDYPISLQDKQPDGESIFQLEFELTGEEIADFTKEVHSNLNGTLPIQLSMGPKEPRVTVTIPPQFLLTTQGMFGLARGILMAASRCVALQMLAVVIYRPGNRSAYRA